MDTLELQPNKHLKFQLLEYLNGEYATGLGKPILFKLLTTKRKIGVVVILDVKGRGVMMSEV